MTFSQDGLYWWDGQAWRPAVSQDGRFRWTGTGWVAIPAPTVAQPTAWTRPLQLAVAAVLVIGLLWALLVLPAMLAAVNGMMAQIPFDSGSSSSLTPAEQESFRRSIQASMVASAAAGLVVGAALYVVLLIGCVKRWRWVFWYQMIVGFFGAVGLVELPFLFASARVSSGLLGGFQLPWWFYVGAAVLDVLVLALSIWMVIAVRRYGTWACVRVPVPASGRAL